MCCLERNLAIIRGARDTCANNSMHLRVCTFLPTGMKKYFASSSSAVVSDKTTAFGRTSM